MTNMDCKTDLEYLYHALQKHPSLLMDQHRKASFERLYADRISENYDCRRFMDTITEFTAFFHDGHTNIEIPYTPKHRCLPLKCCWTDSKNSRLLLTAPYDTIPAGACITDIEDIPMDDVISMISRRIPHENIFLVKSRMIMYPYLNYHIFSEMNLNLLFGPKEYYAVAFLADGRNIRKEIPLSFYDGFPAFSKDEDFLSYEIQNNTVILRLNSCICSETYLSALKELAHICQERQTASFVLDLSQNMGGSSAVIDEFIKFTHVKYFKRYEMIDFSSGKARYITKRQDVVQNPQEKILLPRQIYCKVSHHTFSSARTFAVTLKDNKIAKIIGTETGGRPNSYGMPLKMRMPASGIRFRVSRCYFLRPDAALDDDLTLAPDCEGGIFIEKQK